MTIQQQSPPQQPLEPATTHNRQPEIRRILQTSDNNQVEASKSRAIYDLVVEHTANVISLAVQSMRRNSRRTVTDADVKYAYAELAKPRRENPALADEKSVNDADSDLPAAFENLKI